MPEVGLTANVSVWGVVEVLAGADGAPAVNRAAPG
jgi:hypothetical protein